MGLASKIAKGDNELELELIVGSLKNLTIHPTTIQPTISDGIKRALALDSNLVKIANKIHKGKETWFTPFEDGILHLEGRLCVPKDEEIRTQILSKTHDTHYSVHPGATKIFGETGWRNMGPTMLVRAWLVKKYSPRHMIHIIQSTQEQQRCTKA